MNRRSSLWRDTQRLSTVTPQEFRIGVDYKRAVHALLEQGIVWDRRQNLARDSKELRFRRCPMSVQKGRPSGTHEIVTPAVFSSGYVVKNCKSSFWNIFMVLCKIPNRILTPQKRRL